MKTRIALLLAALSVMPALAATPQDQWKAFVTKETAHWGTDHHAILKLQDAAYLGEGDAVTLVGTKGDSTSWHWSTDAKAKGPVHIVLTHGKPVVTADGKPADIQDEKEIAIETGVDVSGEATPIAAHLNGWRVFLYNDKATRAVEYKGLSWNGFDPSFIVQAKYVADPKFATTTFHTSHKTDKDYYHTGDAVFTLKGKNFTLPIYARSNDAAKIKGAQGFFQDETTGKGSYGAGRYVNIAFDKDANKVDADHPITIDFNQAYNPDCARSPFWTCPLTDVVFNIPVTVGERDPHEHEG